MFYTAAIDTTAVTAEVDFFEIAAPSDACVVLHEVHIGQESEEGDTQAELLAYKIVKGAGATSGSGGGTATPTKKEAGAAAAGSTVETANTTKMTAGGGSIAIWAADAFHVAAGLHYVPTPETRPVVSPSQRITVELAESPADSITFSGYIVFEEIGG